MNKLLFPWKHIIIIIRTYISLQETDIHHDELIFSNGRNKDLFFPYEQVVWFYLYFFTSTIFWENLQNFLAYSKSRMNMKKGDLLLNVKWKLHFHHVNTTQLLRLPCTHLSEPLEHAEGGMPSQAERKNRRNRERKTGRKSIGETSSALNDCVHTEWILSMCVCVCVRVCIGMCV